jgi:hypothetical protein
MVRQLSLKSSNRKGRKKATKFEKKLSQALSSFEFYKFYSDKHTFTEEDLAVLRFSMDVDFEKYASAEFNSLYDNALVLDYPEYIDEEIEDEETGKVIVVSRKKRRNNRKKLLKNIKFNWVMLKTKYKLFLKVFFSHILLFFQNIFLFFHRILFRYCVCIIIFTLLSIFL